MEGEDIECRISDEQCCLQEEDEREISKTKWVVERGVRLGRKIVITGIMVSSAALVIPPLITISILGFVGMVPVGFVLVTEKLMSKLLPMLLEYPAQVVFRDGNRFEEFEGELCGRDFEVHEEMMMEGDGVELAMDSVAVDNNEEESEYVEKHDCKKNNLEGEHKDKKESIMVDEEVVEFSVAECEGKKDTNIDENLEKGYEAGEHKDEKEIIVDDEVAECEYKKDENLEKGYEDLKGEDKGNKEIIVVEEVVEFLEAECEDKKDINRDDNLEEGYEDAIGEYLEGENEGEKDNIDENLEKGNEEDGGEYLEGERKDNKELIIIDEEVVEFLEAEENFEFKSVTLLGNVGSSVTEDEEHLEKPIGFEGEDKKEATSAKGDENPFNVAQVEITMAEVKLTEASLKENECAPETEKHNEIINSNEGTSEEKIWEKISAITISETEKDNNVDENLEKGYEEDAGEYLEGEDEDKKEINSGENSDEGYVEAIGEYLEGKREDENLEKGYEEDTDEYLEGEDEDKKQIYIDENLGELEREREDEKHNNIDENLDKRYEEDEDLKEYLEGEEHEGPMPEMNIEVERGSEEPHFEFGENVKRTEGLDLVGTSARGENYNNNDNKTEENFEFKSVALLVNVSSSVKEDEEHLEEKPRGFEEEDNKKEATSAKEDENPFNVTNAEVEITVADVKLTEASLKENECAQETEKHNEINSNEGVGAPSSEVMVIEEEKIWEKISGIRGILGYTATPQSSTVDELKALFILTGVEPPSPFEDPSDLVDVNHKLRLLMSIVGTK